MKRMKLYEADDKMIDLISDNYSMLQGLNAFGIHLGFGDKTVSKICDEQGVDCHTFLTVVNFLINGYAPKNTDDTISVKTLHDIQLHMKYEEKTLFPYVEALIRGEKKADYNVEIFSKHHSDTTGKFHELKNIIIKYFPHDGLANNQLTATLYDIYNNEEWLCNHSNVEEVLFVPAIRMLEQKLKNDDVSARISNMITKADSMEPLSEREKEIIVCLAQGMSNKEIANQLFISVNTVITHRRNIFRKLQIHSLAGLTIYAIANNLIDKQCFLHQ